MSKYIRTPTIESFNTTIQTNTFIQFTWMISWFCIFLNSELIYMQSTQCSVQRIYTFISSFFSVSEVEENGQLRFLQSIIDGRRSTTEPRGIKQNRMTKKWMKAKKTCTWSKMSSINTISILWTVPTISYHAMPLPGDHTVFGLLQYLFAERVEWLNIILAHFHLIQTLTHSQFLVPHTHKCACTFYFILFFKKKKFFQQHTHLSIFCPHKYSNE